ncbi:universal stress protein [Variovorax sp. M-6]|uniref:universal stress protein n=1 Tax=Variovorax sp. M-6 TaxID=3233041 RepID=UPI003F9A2BA4
MYQRILVPLDGSETSLQGLDEAVRMALRDGATLRLVHVLNKFRRTTGFASHASYSELLPGMKEEGEQLLREARERAERGGAKAETKLLSSLTGGLSEMIADEAADWHADLIVIGTHGRRGIERILWGSDAEQVMRAVNVRVLLVQAPGGDGR